MENTTNIHPDSSTCPRCSGILDNGEFYLGVCVYCSNLATDISFDYDDIADAVIVVHN